MTIAQTVSSADPIVIVIIGLTALLGFIGSVFGVAVAIKSLFFRRVDPDKEYVTRRELLDFEDKINEAVASLKTDLVGRIEKLDSYIHTSSHEQNNIMNRLILKVERLLVLREADLRAKPSAVTPPSDENGT